MDDAAGLRSRRGPARGTDGQLGGRTPQHRRRTRRLPGTHADQPRRERPLAVRQPGSAEAIDGAVRDGRAVHFMGLLSDGGVHSSREHLYALLEMARERGAATGLRARVPRRPGRPARERPRLRRGRRAVHGDAGHRARSRRSWAATTRWTATTAGTGSSGPGRRWCLARGSRPRARPRRCGRRTRPVSPTSSWFRPSLRPRASATVTP